MKGRFDPRTEPLVMAMSEAEAKKAGEGFVSCQETDCFDVQWVSADEAKLNASCREIRLSLEVLCNDRRLVVTEPFGRLRPSLRIWKEGIDGRMMDHFHRAIRSSLNGPLGLCGVQTEAIRFEGLRFFGPDMEVEALFQVVLESGVELPKVSGQYWSEEPDAYWDPRRINLTLLS